MDAARLWLYPQIFWTAIALLRTDFEQEYHQAIKLLDRIVTRFNFADIAVQNVFLTYTPKGWYVSLALGTIMPGLTAELSAPPFFVVPRDPPFTGVQTLVLRGILSVETLASCVDVSLYHSAPISSCIDLWLFHIYSSCWPSSRSCSVIRYLNRSLCVSLPISYSKTPCSQYILATICFSKKITVVLCIAGTRSVSGTTCRRVWAHRWSKSRDGERFNQRSTRLFRMGCCCGTCWCLPCHFSKRPCESLLSL